jgi:hypothetical protein
MRWRVSAGNAARIDRLAAEMPLLGVKDQTTQCQAFMAS